jgi:hypothetical protein
MIQSGALATKRGRVRLLLWAIMMIFAVEIMFFALT